MKNGILESLSSKQIVSCEIIDLKEVFCGNTVTEIIGKTEVSSISPEWVLNKLPISTDDYKLLKELEKGYDIMSDDSIDVEKCLEFDVLDLEKIRELGEVAFVHPEERADELYFLTASFCEDLVAQCYLISSEEE